MNEKEKINGDAQQKNESAINNENKDEKSSSAQTITEPALHQELSKYYLITIDSMSAETKEHFFAIKTGSLENRRASINQMLNMVVVQQRNLRLQMDTRWQQAYILAGELMNDIKKEYHEE